MSEVCASADPDVVQLRPSARVPGHQHLPLPALAHTADQPH